MSKLLRGHFNEASQFSIFSFQVKYLNIVQTINNVPYLQVVSNWSGICLRQVIAVTTE